LTGRNDIGINTKCYNIYHSILRKEKEIQEEWRELCYLWSSDFRTHITPRRWKHFLERLDQSAQNYLNSDDIALGSNATYYNGNLKKCKYYENDNIAIEFNYSKGSSIKNLSFKSLSDIPLITTLDHGYYDDISLGADFYSGHAIIERPAKCKITDLSPGYIKTEERESCFRLEYRHENDSAAFCTRYVIEHDRINIFKEIIINDDIPAIIHPLNFTFNPDAWDKSSLYIETNNGGGSLERFYLNNKFITHNDIYSMQISARHGFGCTGGYLVIGDKAKSILFSNDMAAMALIPTILYKEIDDQIFFRLKYSAGEIDETRKVDNPIQSIISSIYISLVFEQGRLRNGFSI